MKTYISKEIDKTVLGFSHVESRYEEAFKASSYEAHQGLWLKEFPNDHPEMEAVLQNHEQHGITMVKQQCKELKVPWQQGLMEFCRRVESEDLDWWLTGSGALAARGIPLEPHDLDIMVPSGQAGKLRRIFHKEWIEPYLPAQDWVVSYFGVIFLYCRIDIASDPHAWVDEPNPTDFGLYAQSLLEEIPWQGFNIKVPPLKLQLDVNLRRNRIQRAEQISVFMGKS